MAGVVILPEELFGKLKKNILPQWKVCFWSAIIVGLIAHLYKIVNWLPNWDSLVFRYDAQNMVSMGRWFLPVASAPSSFYDLPWITGLLAILFHALGAVCICKMFDVKKNTTAFLIGSAVVSFPTVTSVMLYNYVADSYALSFLLACLAAFFITSEKPKFVLAAILIALSVGIYQAYITVTIMLLLCFLIREVLFKGEKIKTLLIKALKFLLTGAAGMVLYYVVLLVLLKVTGTELLEYQGFDNAATFSNLDILGSLYIIKDSFVSYFFDFSNGLNVFTVVNIIIFVSTSLLYLFEIIKNKFNVSKFLVLCVGAVLLPIGANVLVFLNSSLDYHNLMKMGFFIFYLFFILEYENLNYKTENLNKLKSWFILIVTAVLIFNQVIIANISYHKITIAYEKSYGTLIRLADRIEQTKGANECDSILVLGHLEGSEAYSSNISLDMTGTTDEYILRADDEIVGQSVLTSALNDYCGKDYKFVSGKEKTALLKKIDTDSLNNWPERDSVFVTDNVIVIKLGDER